MESPDPDTQPASGIDYRLFVPLFLHALMVQVIVTMVRVTTSYRAIELELSGVVVGIIAAAFALLPVFLAVRIGRYVDRGNDARAVWIGSAIFVIACVWLLQASTSASGLFLCMALFGVGQLFLMVAHQMLTVRAASDAAREKAFGHYMVATAAGQGLGPLVVGLVGGTSQVPPTNLLFALSLVAALLTAGIACFIRQAPNAHATAAKAGMMPVPELLRLPAIPTLLLASVITVTAQDLIIVYLPLLAAERAIDARNVGLLLSVRSVSAVIVRLFFDRLIRTFGRMPLTVGTMVISSLAYVLIAMDVPLFALYLCVTAIGLGLGVAATLSISNVVDRVPASARGVALSLRITGNRIGQVAFPLGAGVIMTTAGVGSIFWFVAIALATSGWSVHAVSRKVDSSGKETRP